MTIDPEYESFEEILKMLRFTKITSYIIYFINIGAIASLIIVSSIAASGKDETEREAEQRRTGSMIMTWFKAFVFIFNLVTLCYYYKMGQFFMDLL